MSPARRSAASRRYTPPRQAGATPKSSAGAFRVRRAGRGSRPGRCPLTAVRERCPLRRAGGGSPRTWSAAGPAGSPTLRPPAGDQTTGRASRPTRRTAGRAGRTRPCWTCGRTARPRAAGPPRRRSACRRRWRVWRARWPAQKLTSAATWKTASGRSGMARHTESPSSRVPTTSFGANGTSHPAAVNCSTRSTPTPPVARVTKAPRRVPIARPVGDEPARAVCITKRNAESDSGR